MRSSVAVVHELVSALTPGDELAGRHHAGTLAWLTATDDVFRRVKPDTPPRHLVSYVVPIDPDDGAVLLVVHRNAGLWLPPGGHVDPDEHPGLTARRELTEELGVDGSAVDPAPAFLTVTQTVGLDAGHTDVGLWYTARVPRGTRLTPDDREFAGVRWWTRAELAQADPAHFDPQWGRFLAKTG
jgi:8-oxo-dGTP pyrophosphatase MutT (NUDIX family)